MVGHARPYVQLPLLTFSMSYKGYLYGTSPDEGALTPYIHSFFKPGVEKSVIVALITVMRC
jgi:hypothetical protein